MNQNRQFEQVEKNDSVRAKKCEFVMEGESERRRLGDCGKFRRFSFHPDTHVHKIKRIVCAHGPVHVLVSLSIDHHRSMLYAIPDTPDHAAQLVILREFHGEEIEYHQFRSQRTSAEQSALTLLFSGENGSNEDFSEDDEEPWITQFTLPSGPFLVGSVINISCPMM